MEAQATCRYWDAQTRHSREGIVNWQSLWLKCKHMCKGCAHYPKKGAEIVAIRSSAIVCQSGCVVLPSWRTMIHKGAATGHAVKSYCMIRQALHTARISCPFKPQIRLWGPWNVARAMLVEDAWKCVSTANTCTIASWHPIRVFLQYMAFMHNTIGKCDLSCHFCARFSLCLHPHHNATSLNFRTEFLLAEASWYSYCSDTKTGDSSVTSYPSLSVIIPGPHLSLALAKIALDDVPALNFKTAEP